jgi:uncharacterized membrane protein
MNNDINRDWEAVGCYFATAMQEVSTELGGEELAARVSIAAISDEVLPNPGALKILEDIRPGSVERVMTRVEEMQKEIHARELSEIRKLSLRKYGKAILNGFNSYNIFRRSPQTRN